jgi:two-component system sensor histidine kinase KdpD
MTKLANNLLDMARLEAGSAALRREWCALEEIAGSVVTRLRGRLAGHSLKLDVPANLPLVHVDAAMIEQVLENLLENAVKYTPAGTPIELGAAMQENEVVVWVSDRGPGLPPGHEDRLFDKFYRGQAERAQSGVGLGLTICRAIIEAHGGKITAANRPGGGADFIFTVPAAEKPPAVVPEKELSNVACARPIL